MLLKKVLECVREISEPVSFDVYNIVKDIKKGNLELCFYYDTTNKLIKHGYMYTTLRTCKIKNPISFSTWGGFYRSDIKIEGIKNNLDVLCVKGKKWYSDLTDRYAVETILDFMEGSKWFEAKNREVTLSHVVKNNIKKGIYVIRK